MMSTKASGATISEQQEEEFQERPTSMESQALSCSFPPFIFRVLCSLPPPLLSARGESREGRVAPAAGDGEVEGGELGMRGSGD